jgi:hypothetical protein
VFVLLLPSGLCLCLRLCREDKAAELIVLLSSSGEEHIFNCKDFDLSAVKKPQSRHRENVAKDSCKFAFVYDDD